MRDKIVWITRIKVWQAPFKARLPVDVFDVWLLISQMIFRLTRYTCLLLAKMFPIFETFGLHGAYACVFGTHTLSIRATMRQLLRRTFRQFPPLPDTSFLRTFMYLCGNGKTLIAA
jgi:hypothetical protein